MAQLERLARHPSAPVLLEGESGTGKTTLARRLHQLSPRASGPFCHVILSAIDDSLAGSELFGHIAGAFTGAKVTRQGQFASAKGGTLFLDEIGKTSRAIQQMLLHAVESHEIRPLGADRTVRIETRIVAASNIALEELVEDGSFLPDLYARFEAFRIVLPPLRERQTDIPGLAVNSVLRHSRECGYSSPPAVSDDLMAAFVAAPWPNNVRQLDSTIQRLMIEAQGEPVLLLSHCRDHLRFLRETTTPVALNREMAERAVAAAGGVSAAARSLGVHRTTLHRHLRDRSAPQE